MKKLFLSHFLFFIPYFLFAQNIGIGTTTPVSRLEITHNGASTYGTALLLNQNAIGNSDGPRIQFYKTMVSSKSWTVGMLNGVNVGSFSINEDGGTNGFGTPRLVITTGGDIGIGTSNPLQRLHVEGGGFFNGNVGIGVTFPSEKLEINGNVKADNFTYTTPKTFYYSVNPSAFKPLNSTDNVRADNSETYYNTTTAWGMLMAPLNLPHGATVTSITVYYYDHSGPTDLNIYLLYKNVGLAAFTSMANVSTAGMPPEGSISIGSINSPLINNQQKTYAIFAGSFMGQGLVNWPGTDLRIKDIVIAYTLTQP